MAVVKKIDLNGSVFDFEIQAQNVKYNDGKTAEQVEIKSVDVTEEATGVKIEVKTNDNTSFSDSIGLATDTTTGVVKVDTTLSDTSVNPVQNKAVKTELDKKIETIKVNGTAVTPATDKSINIPDTTYTFESADDKLIITPSVNGATGTAVNVDVKVKDNITGTGEAGALALFDTAQKLKKQPIDLQIDPDSTTHKVTSTNIPTSKAVADYVEQEFGDLVGAMSYKGSIDTSHPLPTTGYKQGDVYVVAAEGDYAASFAKVGDMFIAKVDYDPATGDETDWTQISPKPHVENFNKTIGTTLTPIANVDGTTIYVKNEFDTTLSDTSVNAVQNKIVKEELDKKAQLVEIATAAGAAKLSLAEIVALKSPQFTYQGQDVVAQKIAADECIWYRVDGKKLYTYKQTASGMTSSYKELAFMEDADLLDSNGEFYAALLDVMHGTSGGIYFAEAGNTDDFLAHIYAKTSSGKEALYFQDGSGHDVTLRGVDTPTRPEDAVNKAYADRHEIYNGGTTQPYLSKFTNAQIYTNKDVRYMFKGYDLTYKSTPTATKAEFFYLVGNEEHTVVVENNKITETVEKLAQLNEIEVLKTGQEQKLVVKFVDSSAGDVTFAAGTYYDANDKKVKNYKNEGSTPTLKLSETPSPNVIYLDDLTKKLYQWNSTTELMVEIPTGGDTLIQILYADLVNLKNTKKLVPGTKYRIIDFVTTATSDNNLGNAVTSALHPFDVVVTALSNEILDENATTMLHDGDTYFAGQKITSWDIKYCLTNDVSRFAWANPLGKGVIFYMKDEHGNEAGYDFKNILQDGRFTFGDTDDATLTAYNDFGNVIQPTIDNDGTQILTEVILGSNCQNNHIDATSFGIYLEEGSALNEIGPLNGMITISGAGGNKLIGTSSNITIGSDSNNNTFGEFNNNITLEMLCANNTFGDYCSDIEFDVACTDNSFASVQSITFGSNCRYNTMGFNCDSITFGNGWWNLKFGNDCSGVKFFNADQTTDFTGILMNSEIASGTSNVGFAFTVGNAADSLNAAERIHVHDGFHPTTFTIYDVDVTQFPNSSQIEVALDSEGNYIVWNDADVAMLLKYCDFIPFNSDVDYDEGQHVTYKGKLYQFNQDHPAGAWDADHADVTSVRQQLNHMYELEKVLTTSVVDLQTRLADIEDYLP